MFNLFKQNLILYDPVVNVFFSLKCTCEFNMTLTLKCTCEFNMTLTSDLEIDLSSLPPPR